MSRVKGCVRPKFVQSQAVEFCGQVREIVEIRLFCTRPPQYDLGTGLWFEEKTLKKLKNDITWEMFAWKPEGLRE